VRIYLPLLLINSTHLNMNVFRLQRQKSHVKNTHQFCLHFVNSVISWKCVLGVWAEVAKCVWCLATGWTTEVRSRQRRKNISSSFCVQTGSGVHPVSCTMGTGGPFTGAKARPGPDADSSPHLVPRSWMSRSYKSSPPALA
jgi:hypothetical protein